MEFDDPNSVNLLAFFTCILESFDDLITQLESMVTCSILRVARLDSPPRGLSESANVQNPTCQNVQYVLNMIPENTYLSITRDETAVSPKKCKV
jgi:hypothetical protein